MINLQIDHFIPCYINQFYLQVGIATLELLQKLGLDLYYPIETNMLWPADGKYRCRIKALPTFKNFVNNLSKFDYLDFPKGSCVYQVREHCSKKEETGELWHQNLHTEEGNIVHT